MDRVQTEVFKFLEENVGARRGFRGVAILFFVSGVGMSLTLLISSALKLAKGEADIMSKIALPLALLVIGWVTISASATFTTSADIRHDETGLHFHITKWWSVRLDATDLSTAEISRSEMPLPYRNLEAGEMILVIKSDALPFIYRLAALYYEGKSQAMAVITPDHSDYLRLIEIVEGYRENNLYGMLADDPLQRWDEGNYEERESIE